ncbi:glycosyltransferase family 2 protein [Pedobacter boryungensis]|uniref:Glycosyltransferase family 2 protein n=1 Tax=Pedobacter boryungensis TaxID=869962 RepID=A0ABX2D842_9SPHI|nr:glycosyltransferase family 2 protein [Pedobacter boryungensis]NQX30177.1 glycosyltransferase family 2 protein [Pedobacter boryungensis]
MTSPLVSIIIPLYNAENHLVETIECVINQTWSHTEIIIIDDGSTDNSYQIAKKYESENIIVVKQENKGASAARNNGLAIAKGKYIQFLDADDLINREKIELQVKLLEQNEGYLSICSTVYFNDGENILLKEPINSWTDGYCGDNLDFVHKLFGGNFIGSNYGGMVTIHSWLCPKSILEIAGPWNESLSMDDDGEYFCRVILKASGICYAPGALNYYRQHFKNKNLSAQLTFKGFESMLNATDLKFNHLKDKIDLALLHKVFSLHYQQIATATYPKFKSISKKAVSKAEEMGVKQIKYLAGPVSTFLSNFLGWKLVRLINYWRFK